MVSDAKERGEFLRRAFDLYRMLEHIVSAVAPDPDPDTENEMMRKGIARLANDVQTTLMTEAQNETTRYVDDHRRTRRPTPLRRVG